MVATCDFCDTEEGDGVGIYTCDSCGSKCCTVHSENGEGQTIFCEECFLPGEGT